VDAGVNKDNKRKIHHKAYLAPFFQGGKEEGDVRLDVVDER
jgi:hypothetical protein